MTCCQQATMNAPTKLFKQRCRLSRPRERKQKLNNRANIGCNPSESCRNIKADQESRIDFDRSEKLAKGQKSQCKRTSSVRPEDHKKMASSHLPVLSQETLKNRTLTSTDSSVIKNHDVRKSMWKVRHNKSSVKSDRLALKFVKIKEAKLKDLFILS